MSEPISFYSENIKGLNTTIASLKTKLALLSSFRLTVFVLTAILLYVLFPNTQLILLTGVLGAVIFMYLLSQYTLAKSNLRLNKALLNLNTEEVKIASGDFHHRTSGATFQNPDHDYSFDVDIFGKGSFFQYINRTVLNSGQELLAKQLTANTITTIEKRQDAVKELSQHQEWSQLFAATGALIDVETTSKHIVNWLKTHNSFVPQYMIWIPWLFSGLSVVLIVLAVLSAIDIGFLGYWLLVGLGVTGFYVKNINTLAFHSNKAKATFKQYADLLLQIEQANFKSDLLVEKQEQIQLEGLKASTIFKQFSKHLDALDNRNNLIGAIFGNGYLLLDLKNAYRIERWIERYANKVEDWFETIAFFDAYNSLGTFAFNHQNYSFPRIDVSSGSVIKAKALGHPMLSNEKRITSDVDINKQQFFIVTGANMAGKSTFLRTISLHIIMANIGLPVCAESSHYTPIKLITSMRTSDSLTDDSSYFFSELKRLKSIVSAIENASYFIVLDEILKGTNSTDKAIGSKKFVEKLVRGNATGVIATHDLSLCEISKKLDAVENYYFATDIIDDELHFDYKLKKGICQNMNASFLLKKMEIV